MVIGLSARPRQRSAKTVVLDVAGHTEARVGRQGVRVVHHGATVNRLALALCAGLVTQRRRPFIGMARTARGIAIASAFFNRLWRSKVWTLLPATIGPRHTVNAWFIPLLGF